MRNPKEKVSDPNKFETSPGSDIHILYNAKLLPNGEIRLTESGKESISEKINAQKEMTDIHYIIQRLSVGDTSMLRDGAVYGDFTNTPKSLAEAMQIMIDGEKKFYELPLDVRAKFDHNYYQWLMSAGSEDWMQKMDISPVVEKVEEEVKTDES